MPLAVLAAAVAVSLAVEQERPVPEFRADVRVIRLDVSVVNRSGQPVPGLAPADFTVLEDGRPVAIAYFEAVDPRGGGAVTGADPAVVVAPPPPRRILLLVDAGRMSVGQLIRARQSAAPYLRETAAPGDWVRLVNLSTGRAWDGRIPEDRQRLEAAARTLDRRLSHWADAAAETEWGRFDDPIEERVETDAVAALASEAETSGQFLSVFAQSTGLLGVLEALLVQLERVEGRKAVVLLSPGFPQLMGLDRQLQRVATLAREAAAAVYFLDAVGLDGLIPEPGRKLQPAFELAWTRSGGAQDLAEASGGFTFRFGNSLLPALNRVSAEMQTYYVLGYVPPRGQDGRFRSVQVKVGVPGLVARTKKGYLAGR